ncbi:MAG: DUF3108 domain-containing protein [Bacteroidota bacterium]
MKKLVTALSVLVILCSFLAAQNKAPKVIPTTKNSSYGVGEELQYRVHLAFFTVGTGITRVDKKIHEINSRPCYKVDAYGKTADWISWVSKFDDNWGAYIDTTTLSTQVAYRKLKEGNYRRDEVVNFDQEKNKVEIRVKNDETGMYDNPKTYSGPKNAKDLVSGFLFLRTVDFTKIAKNDTIIINGFLEKEFYDLKIIYRGKETISTKVGKIQCLKLSPVMPPNSLFDGENSILCWISDDMNRIPISIKAKMFIGNSGLELTNFRGLKYQLKTVQ